jgi:hypothetical protein
MGYLKGLKVSAVERDCFVQFGSAMGGAPGLLQIVESELVKEIPDLYKIQSTYDIEEFLKTND